MTNLVPGMMKCGGGGVGGEGRCGMSVLCLSGMRAWVGLWFAVVGVGGVALGHYKIHTFFH
ncbi:MAG: hypothetical protein GY832_40520 [Chloroflexi bacterium]|nr:hypothetical protein [Chloroflexota bacterium]